MFSLAESGTPRYTSFPKFDLVTGISYTALTRRISSLCDSPAPLKPQPLSRRPLPGNDFDTRVSCSHQAVPENRVLPDRRSPSADGRPYDPDSSAHSPSAAGCDIPSDPWRVRSEEHTSELQSANISYAVFC